jgi:hypothetical protein
MGLYNRMIRKFVQLFTKVQEEVVGAQLPSSLPADHGNLKVPVEDDLEEELQEAGRSFLHHDQKKLLKDIDLAEYTIMGQEKEWEEALGSGKQMGVVSVARLKRKKSIDVKGDEKQLKKPKRHNKH